MHIANVLDVNKIINHKYVLLNYSLYVHIVFDALNRFFKFILFSTSDFSHMYKVFHNILIPSLNGSRINTYGWQMDVKRIWYGYENGFKMNMIYIPQFT